MQEVYVLLSEKNGYKNFVHVFADRADAERWKRKLEATWNKGTEAGYEYYIIETLLI